MKNHEHPPSIDETFDWNAVYTGSASDYEPPNGEILRRIVGLSPERALDIGCGAGGLVVALSQAHWRVTGIDVAATAIASAREVTAQHGVEARLEVADAGSWRPDGEFELITNSFALPFGVAARAEVFAMIRGALVPGGTVVVEDFDASMARSGFLAGTDLVTVEELVQAFQGFEIEQAEVIETPVHEHRHDAGHDAGNAGGERWTAAIFHARKPV